MFIYSDKKDNNALLTGNKRRIYSPLKLAWKRKRVARAASMYTNWDKEGRRTVNWQKGDDYIPLGPEWWIASRKSIIPGRGQMRFSNGEKSSESRIASAAPGTQSIVVRKRPPFTTKLPRSSGYAVLQPLPSFGIINVPSCREKISITNEKQRKQRI